MKPIIEKQTINSSSPESPALSLPMIATTIIIRKKEV